MGRGFVFGDRNSDAMLLGKVGTPPWSCGTQRAVRNGRGWYWSRIRNHGNTDQIKTRRHGQPLRFTDKPVDDTLLQENIATAQNYPELPESFLPYTRIKSVPPPPPTRTQTYRHHTAIRGAPPVGRGFRGTRRCRIGDELAGGAHVAQPCRWGWGRGWLGDRRECGGIEQMTRKVRTTQAKKKLTVTSVKKKLFADGIFVLSVFV